MINFIDAGQIATLGGVAGVGVSFACPQPAC